MDDISRKKEIAKEKMLEAMLEYAGACHVENIANEALEEAFDISVPYPPNLDMKIKKMIARHERENRFNKILFNIRKSAPKAAMALFAVMVCFFITIAGVEAFRVKFLNFIIEVEERYTSIGMKENDSLEESTDESSKIPSDWNNIYIPEYIPEGYKIAETQSLISTKTILYINSQNNMITFNQYNDKDTEIRVDTENAEINSILINGFKALIIYKEGTITIAWHNNELAFSLRSRIDKNDLIKMAESLKKN